MGHQARQPGHQGLRHQDEQRGRRQRPLYPRRQQCHLRRCHRQEHHQPHHQRHCQGQRQDLQGHQDRRHCLQGPEEARFRDHRKEHHHHRPGSLQRLQKAPQDHHQNHQTEDHRQGRLLRHSQQSSLRPPQRQGSAIQETDPGERQRPEEDKVWE